MRLNDGQFKKMADSVKGGKDTGFSEHAYRQNRSAPKIGYMVSIPGYEKQIRSENVTPAHIKEFAEKHADKLGDPNMYVGGWNSGSEVSLDVSQNIKPKKKVAREYGRDVADADARTSAMDLSIARNQEAAWDVKRGKSIDNKDFDPKGRRGSV